MTIIRVVKMDLFHHGVGAVYGFAQRIFHRRAAEDAPPVGEQLSVCELCTGYIDVPPDVIGDVCKFI